MRVDFDDYRDYRTVLRFTKANQRLNFLIEQSSSVCIAVTPDYGEKGIINNGMHLVTDKIVYPLFMGTDIGCGFFCCLFNDAAEQVKDRLKSYCDIYSNKSENLFGNREINQMYFENSLELPPLLQPGNHFIEIRKVFEIIDSKSCARLGIDKSTHALMIHMGCGAELEYNYKKFILKYIDECETNKNGDGYSLSFTLDSKAGIEFMCLANKCIQSAARSRKHLSDYLLGSLYRVCDFDTPHDFIYQKNDKVYHYKSIQHFTTTLLGDIALMPGDLGDHAYIVKKKPNAASFMNHGLMYSFSNNKKYESASATIRHCESVGLCSPIMSLDEYVRVKMFGKKLMYAENSHWK